MKKSKHFRKDVIMARVIAGVLVIVLIVLLVLAVSILTKPSGSNKDTQNTQSTENTQKEELDVDISTEYGTETEFETELESESETESETESESEVVSTDKTYVITTSPIRLRKEPNTECATIELLEPDVKLEVLETLDGWYKVSHNGQEGYVSATYVEVEES